jgi:metal-responsive CopG/Arc/MetJ family transcriptional regulator
MPRPGPRRTAVGARLSDQELAGVDRLVAEQGTTRGEVIREMVQAGLRAAARQQARRERIVEAASGPGG